MRSAPPTSRGEILTALRGFAGGVPAHGGAVCLLTGPSGIGKTKLAQEFLARLPEDTVKLVGAATPVGTPPLLPICRAVGSDRREHVVEQISSILLDYSQAVPLLKETFGPLVKAHRQRRQGGRLPPDLVPKETYTFFALTELLRRVSSRTRTVLFIDDVQWLDASSIAFLAFLFGELATVPVLVLLAATTHGAGPPELAPLRTALARVPEACATFELPPLSASEAVHVAERHLGGPLEHTPADAEWITRTTRGNPKYLREVVALLRQRGNLTPAPGGWRFSSPLAGLVLPPSLKDTTLALGSPLFLTDPDAEKLIHYAAACGDDFDVRLVARLAQVPLHRAMSLLKRLADATGLVERNGDTTVWRFDHQLTREAILSDLGTLARGLHQELAMLLEGDKDASLIDLGYHWREAGEWRLAAEKYGRLAEEAGRRFAFAEAVAAARQRDDLLNRAGCPGDAEERLAAAEQVGHFLVLAQRYREAVEYLGKLRELGLARRRFRLLHTLARAQLNLPETRSHTEAVDLLRAAIDHLEPDHDAEVGILLWNELIIGYDSIAKYPASQAAFRAAYKAATEAKDVLWCIRLARLSCMFWQPEKVIDWLNRALPLARRHAFHFEEAACWNNLGTQWWYLHDLGRAQECFESARRLLARCGGYRKDIPINNRGLIALAGGDVDGARALIKEALDVALTEDDRLLIRINAAVAEAMAGELDTAEVALKALAVEADATGDDFYSDCAHYNLGRVLLLRGRAKEAAEAVSASRPRHWNGDDDLIRGKRAALLAEAHAILGHEPEPNWERERRVLHETTKPQAWLYRLPFELCDVQFW